MRRFLLQSDCIQGLFVLWSPGAVFAKPLSIYLKCSMPCVTGQEVIEGHGWRELHCRSVCQHFTPIKIMQRDKK